MSGLNKSGELDDIAGGLLVQCTFVKAQLRSQTCWPRQSTINYRSARNRIGHTDYKSVALPTELSRHWSATGASNLVLQHLVAALPDELMAVWWPLLNLNQRPGDYESHALTN